MSLNHCNGQPQTCSTRPVVSRSHTLDDELSPGISCLCRMHAPCAESQCRSTISTASMTWSHLGPQLVGIAIVLFSVLYTGAQVELPCEFVEYSTYRSSQSLWQLMARPGQPCHCSCLLEPLVALPLSGTCAALFGARCTLSLAFRMPRPCMHSGVFSLDPISGAGRNIDLPSSV